MRLQHDLLVFGQTELGGVQGDAASLERLAVTELLVKVTRSIVFGANDNEWPVASIDHLLGERLRQMNAITKNGTC